MAQQPAQFGCGLDAPILIHRLFFAVFPDEAARHAIARVAEELRTSRRVRGRWIDPLRYHVTLHFLGDNPELRRDIVDRGTAAAGRVAMPAFRISFDRLASFHGRTPPGVLLCPDQATPVHALWQALGCELLAAGLGAGVEPRFTPHVTLFHGDDGPLEPESIAPIAWTARAFVLVHSVVGQKDYRVLGNWQLQG